MRCEICGHETEADRCGPCGPAEIVERVGYRARVQGTLIGWNRAGVVDAAALGRMLAQLQREKQALQDLVEPRPQVSRPAPVREQPVLPQLPPPPPRIEPVPWPKPRPEAKVADERRSLDGWIRQSAGWLVGAALTVVGSVYLAGTLWDGLSAGWRTAITLLFLAVWSLGFAAAGRRLLARGFGAGRWLIGVGAALAPVHAMAAGALWPHPGAAVALGAVALVQGWALWRAAADLAPGAGLRLWTPWIALSLLAGFMPLHVGLTLPTLALALGVWGLCVRGGGPVGSVAVLLAFDWLLLALVPGPRPIVGYALPLAGLAAIALYADLAWARWRGLWRVGLEGWRGVIVGGLVLLALGCTVPSFAPAPSGWAVFATYLVVGLVAVGAALAWRRPTLVGFSLVACLCAALTLPSLARPLVEWASHHASVGLGYGGAPLPLAWRALTLVPWLGGWLIVARWLPETGWRQAAALQEQLRRWVYGIALALLALSPTLPHDPRPFLLAGPIYAVLGLLRPRIRVPGAVAVAIASVPIVVGAGWLALLCHWLGAPAWTGQLAVTAWLVGVVVGWPDRRVALVGWPTAALLFAVGPAGWATVGIGVVGLAALWVPGDREPRMVVAAVSPALLLLGAGLEGHAHLAWSLLAATLAIAGTASWVHRRDDETTDVVLGWAAAGVVATAGAGLALVDPGRILLRLCLGALLLRWTWEHRERRALAQVFGAGLALGIVETVWRRLGLLGVPPELAVSGGALAVALWAQVRGRPWLVDGVATPARWVGAAVVAGGTAWGLWVGLSTPAAAVPVLALVLAAWLLAPRGTAWPAWVAIALGAGSKATAVPAGLAMGLAMVPGVGLVAAAVAALNGAFHGPAGAGWVGIAAAVAGLGWAARAQEELRAPAVFGTLAVAALALAGVVHPPLAVYPLLAVIVGGALSLTPAGTPWRQQIAETGHWTALGAVPAVAVLVALPGHPGPLETAAAVLATGYAVWAKEAWVARGAAALALVAGLQWVGAPAAAWVLCATAAVVVHHLVSRPAERAVVWLELMVVAGIVPPLVASAWDPLPVALCWPALAWVVGASAVALGARLERGFLVPIGLAVALVQASVPMGPAWGLLLAAMALGVTRDGRVRALVLGVGVAWLVGSAAGMTGSAQVALLAAATVGYRWWKAESALDTWTTAALTAAAGLWAGAGLLGSETGLWQLAGPPVLGAAIFAGTASFAAPAQARWVLGPLGALLLAGAFGVVTGVDHGVGMPIVLAVIAGAVALTNRASITPRQDADVLLALATVAPVVAFASGRDFGVAAAQIGLVSLAAVIRGRPELAASAATAALLCAAQRWIPAPMAAELAVLLGMGWACASEAPVTSMALRVALPVVGTAAVPFVGLGPLGWAILGVGNVAELVFALRGREPLGMWAPLAYGGLVLGVARLVGPLASVPLDLVVPAAVGLAVLLEALGVAVEKRRGTAFAEPVRHATVALLVAALVHSSLLGMPTALGLAAAGALFCGRHALRGGVPDLIVGALLLDAGAVVLALQVGLGDPLPYVAPFSLSALIVAQRLRGTLQAEAVTLIRYVAAGALYVTCFGQGVLDPLWTSVLVLLALVGILAGELLRVRSFLHLGIGALMAALGWNLLRFGLEHSRFWALYLTGLGVVVLGAMVVVTLNREGMLRARQRLLAHVASWER